MASIRIGCILFFEAVFNAPTAIHIILFTIGTEADAKNGDPINYLVAMKYLETFKEMAGGQDNKTVFCKEGGF